MIGYKVYYDLQTGNEVLTIPEQHSINAKPTTVEQDFMIYSVLQERTRESVGVKEFEYGEFRTDFQTSNSWKIDIETGNILFNYPVYTAPYSQLIDELMKTQGDLLLEIALLKAGGNE